MNEGIPIAVEPIIPTPPPPEAIQPNIPIENVSPNLVEKNNPTTTTPDSYKITTKEESEEISKIREQLGISDTGNRTNHNETNNIRKAEELRKMSYYERLNLSSDANQEDIKASRKIMFDYHPDTGGDEEAMKEINEAYSILSDAELRKKYDEKLSENHREDTKTAPDFKTYSYPNPENMSREFWQGMNGSFDSIDNPRQNFASPEQLNQIKNMINEKIQQLENRDPDEFITREQTLYHSSAIETTVGEYIKSLKEILDLTENDRIKVAELSDIVTKCNGKIKFLGKSKFKKWWRKSMQI